VPGYQLSPDISLSLMIALVANASHRMSGSAPNRPDFPERENVHQLQLFSSITKMNWCCINSQFKLQISRSTRITPTWCDSVLSSHRHHKYFNFLGVPITICLELTAHSLIQFRSPVPRHIIYAKLSRNMAFDPGVCSIRNPLHPWKIWLEALIKIWYQ